MVRYCFAIGAVLTAGYDIIYLGLRFSMFGIKVDNVKSTNSDHLSSKHSTFDWRGTINHTVVRSAIQSPDDQESLK
jgi:hypothetical protein